MSLDTLVYFDSLPTPTFQFPPHIVNFNRHSSPQLPGSLTLQQIFLSIPFLTSGALPLPTTRVLNSADRLFHSVDFANRNRKHGPQIIVASILDRINVAANFLSALPAWIEHFFGLHASQQWIKPSYTFGGPTYNFSSDGEFWTGNWESPDDIQVSEDLLLPFATNLPIHIENMSLVTATQACNPFE